MGDFNARLGYEGKPRIGTLAGTALASRTTGVINGFISKDRQAVRLQ